MIDILRIFKLPSTYYFLITTIFFIYIGSNWRKYLTRKLLYASIFYITLMFVIYQLSFSMISIYLLETFHADNVIIEHDSDRLNVEANKILISDSGIYMRKQNIEELLLNFRQEPYITLWFYKNNKLITKFKVYQSSDETPYSGLVNNMPVIIKWHGRIIKLNNEFYVNLDRFI
ncbi:hypothetical protein SAMN02194393_04757 [Maledivibacter halophilus]|uniref:Uncharacterized protein n=2 Tax=Maledivibacter halophilus TaxID=36842 RepID=A0A1T5MIT7_9FIRM|nr:hypothetical protein SAMN02194393_04757 [Maledivibacter halophilus]